MVLSIVDDVQLRSTVQTNNLKPVFSRIILYGGKIPMFSKKCIATDWDDDPQDFKKLFEFLRIKAIQRNIAEIHSWYIKRFKIPFLFSSSTPEYMSILNNSSEPDGMRWYHLIQLLARFKIGAYLSGSPEQNRLSLDIAKEIISIKVFDSYPELKQIAFQLKPPYDNLLKECAYIQSLYLINQITQNDGYLHFGPELILNMSINGEKLIDKTYLGKEALSTLIDYFNTILPYVEIYKNDHKGIEFIAQKTYAVTPSLIKANLTVPQDFFRDLMDQHLYFKEPGLAYSHTYLERVHSTINNLFKKVIDLFETIEDEEEAFSSNVKNRIERIARSVKIDLPEKYEKFDTILLFYQKYKDLSNISCNTDDAREKIVRDYARQILKAQIMIHFQNKNNNTDLYLFFKHIFLPHIKENEQEKLMSTLFPQ